MVRLAQAGGADVAEASASSGWELTTKVRLGETELVQEAGHRHVAIRVICSQRVAVSSTSDWSESGIVRCVEDALELAKLSEPDSFAGPADPSLLSHGPYPDLELFDSAVDKITPEKAVGLAKQAEQVALDSDPRLALSEGATFSRVSGWSSIALSNGFSGTRRGSFASLSVVPVVEDEGGKKRRGHYWTGGRHLESLDSVHEVGKKAAERTLRQLGARKVPSCRVPVIFDTDVSKGLVSTLIGCAMGGAIWRKSSYLVDRCNTPIASDIIHIVDDPLIPRAPGSRAFDGEGLASRKNVVVEGGVLKMYLLDSYCGRKLGLPSTASAGRSGGGVGASASNLILQQGTQSVEDLIADTPRGLYVTEMMGFGFNAVTGDFSRGAAGFWIENGKLSHAVSEVTISSNLDTMFKGIDGLANDMKFQSSTSAPTFRVSEMVLAGS